MATGVLVFFAFASLTIGVVIAGTSLLGKVTREDDHELDEVVARLQRELQQDLFAAQAFADDPRPEHLWVETEGPEPQQSSRREVR